MRLAIIGIGHVAEHQMRAVEVASSIELVAAHDQNPARAAALPEDVRFFDSLNDLLASSKPDVCLVSTPTQTHFDIATTVLDAGRGVVIEKPACLTRAELNTLRARAREEFVHVAFHAAFAPELLWWLENSDIPGLGRLEGFNCGFFDPYIKEGRLEPKARALLGSWIDSGINALSTVARIVDPRSMCLDTARMTRLQGLECREIQGTGVFSFAGSDGVGRGVVDTNWTLGLNQKTTHLWYTHGDVLLHHSKRTVSVRGDRGWRLLRDLSDATPRLEQHYQGLFADLAGHYHRGLSNVGFAFPVHELFLAALQDDASVAAHGGAL